MKSLLLLAALSFPLAAQLHAEAPTTTESTIVDPTSKDDLKANEGKTVTVEGKIASAKWSKSGKVMNAKFEGSDLSAVIFSANKDKLDEQFSGDVAKALEGAKVKIKGKLEDFKGKPEIRIMQGSQITIEEPAASTKPAE